MAALSVDHAQKVVQKVGQMAAQKVAQLAAKAVVRGAMFAATEATAPNAATRRASVSMLPVLI